MIPFWVPVLALLAQPGPVERAQNAERKGDYRSMREEARRAGESCGADAACRMRAKKLEGTASYYLGEMDRAVAEYQEALTLARAAGDAAQQAVLLNNAGGVRFVQGRYSEALSAYDEAWALVRDDDTRQLTLANQASLFQRLGRDQAALAIYQQLRTMTAVLPQSEQARVLSNLGALLRRLGDPVKARQSYEGALALFRQDRQMDGELATRVNLSILEALEFQNYEAAREGFREVLAHAVRTGNQAEAVQARLYLAETEYRSGEFEAAAGLWREALAPEFPEEQWKAEYGLARVALRDGDRTSAASHLERAIRVIESLRSSIARGSLRTEFLAAKRDVYDMLVDIRLSEPYPDLNAVLEAMERARARSMQDALPAGGELTVAGLRKHLGGDTALLVFWSGRGRTAVVWITPKDAGWGDGVPGPAMLGGMRNLIVIPDGKWYERPLDGEVAVLKDHAVWYLPAVRFLGEAKPAQWLWPWETQMLTIGGGEIPADKRHLLPGDESWVELAGVDRELHVISGLMPGRTVAARDGKALEGRLPSIVHIAAHAAADSEDPTRSRILLGGRYWFLPEVRRLALAGVDLVTLSACETERGRDTGGEGPQSLARAFLAAGAHATVASLWKVDDAATAEFMKQFYAGLARGLTKAEALRHAKLRLAGSGTVLADPRHWAAFVLTGEGGSPLPPVVSWPALLSLAALVTVLLAALLFGFRGRGGSVRRGRRPVFRPRRQGDV